MHRLATASKKIHCSDIGTDLAGSCRRLKKFPECGFQALLEVRWQNVEGHRNAVKARTGAPLTSGSP
jgi:hypothetical protein